MTSVPWSVPHRIPADYRLHPGRGLVLRPGHGGAIVAYGPVMLSEAFRAAALLERRGHSLAVIGQSAFVAAALHRLRLAINTHVFGIEGVPACGENREVLDHHGLSAERLAERMWAVL